MPSEPRWHRAAGAPWRRTFEATLIGTDTGIVELRGPARLLWELADVPTTEAVLLGALASAFDLPIAAVEAEATRAIQELQRSGALAATGGIAITPRVTRRPLHASGRSRDPVEQLAAWGIAAGGTDDDRPWDTMLPAITRERLSGLAFGAITAGDSEPSTEALASLRAMHREAMLVAIGVERAACEVLGALADAGITPVIHKGPSIAHTVYDDPAHRPFGDVDLLVHPADLDRAFAVLVALGYRRRYPQPRPGFDRRFGKGAAFVAADGTEIDLHRSFAAGPFGLTIDVEEVHAARRTAAVLDGAAATMAPEHQLIATAVHAALGDRHPRVLNLRDIAQLLAVDAIDPDAVVRAACRWKVDGPVAAAIVAAAGALGIAGDEPLVAWAGKHEPSRAQRSAMRAYTAPSRSYATQSIAAVRVIPGVRDRAAYLRAMLLPDRSYLADRDRGLLRRWTRIVRTAVRR